MTECLYFARRDGSMNRLLKGSKSLFSTMQNFKKSLEKIMITRVAMVYFSNWRNVERVKIYVVQTQRNRVRTYNNIININNTKK
jgi:phosphoribosylcarboxyaminoimidazole (NCAIR) mutase